MLLNLELWFRLYFPDGQTLSVTAAEPAALAATGSPRGSDRIDP